MKQYPYWKPALILLVIAISAFLIYPLKQKLKPGLDLAGGTILLYQVDVPEGANADDTVEQTIASLRKRVDPNGVRNLVWRPVVGNRIEIQMAMASTETKALRQAYLAAREELAQGNLTKGQVASVLRLPAGERQAAIAQLARANDLRVQNVQDVAQAYDALQTAREAYDEFNQRLIQAQDAGKKIPAAAAEAIKENQDYQAELLREFVPVTRAYNQATQRYNDAMDKLLATNVDPGHLEHVLNLPPVPTRGSKAADAATDLSYREPALEKLLTEHPDRKEDIQQVIAKYDAYSQVKGALDDPNDLIALLRGSGVLEFRIAANSLSSSEVEEYRQQLRERGPRGGDQPHRWFRVDDISAFADRPSQRTALEANPEAYFNGRGLIGQRYAGDYYILLSDRPESTITKSKPDWELSRAAATADENGFPAVSFQLNPTGGQYMSELTGNHRNQPMAIVLDGRVISAPNINDRIGASGIITGGSGGFSQRELQYLVRTLNAGSLQARLGEQPISIKTIGPGLGQDNLRHGLQAAGWAMALISVFMILYYFHWGVVAVIALALNVLLILAAMSMLQATFTLPGIAGIVLTIGMAIDANVLILERIREELERKADLKTAVRLGYEKALSAIIDSNVTSLFICVILYYTATAEVKGFGLTLGLGIVASMFTALFFTHVVADLFLRLVNPKSAPMLALVVPAVRKALTPNINWMRYRKAMVVFSVVTVIASLGLVIYRGSDLLDIEFRSGTQVSFDIKGGKEMALQDVRSRLDKAADQFNMPELAGSRATVVTLGETEVRDKQVMANSFSVSTLNEDSKAVSNAIKEVFADVLETQRPISFTGEDAQGLNQAPIRPVTSANLGSVINRPTVTDDVTDAVGGVVVLLENLQPAATVQQLTSRIQQVQMQAEYAQLGYRPFKVVGIDLASQQDGDAPLYTSAAVVAYDNTTNYLEDPASFTRDEQGLAATQWTLVKTAMQIDTSLASVSNFSSTVSRTMQQQAIAAMVLSLIAVMGYVWLRFGRLTYGLGGIIALAHDVIIALGMVSLAGLIYTSLPGQWLGLTNFKIDLAMIAALLTIVGYSINDTIIIYDRIRENRGRLAYASAAVINDSINQAMSRTVLTSGTTLLSALALYVIGGDGVHGFAFAMIIGVLVGTYSSIFIASPLLLVIKAPEPTPIPTTTTRDPENAAVV